MGNQERTYDTCLYEFSVKTVTGKIVLIQAYGMQDITGPVSVLDKDCLIKLFPDRDPRVLQRKSTTVDVLLGCDYFGLHPKHEVCSVGHLSIMQGELGVCLQGCHQDIQESTSFSLNMVRTIHDKKVNHVCLNVLAHPEFSNSSMGCSSYEDLSSELPGQAAGARTISNSANSRIDNLNNFIRGEELATEISPKCGGCKCGKCPVVGHTYSFREQQELNMIRENLRYNSDLECWSTSYPWIMDPHHLPDNYYTALATLKSTEHTLKKDETWAKLYSEQIADMLDRQVAQKLASDEIDSWHGPRFYISHLAVSNPQSKSTPIRIVFNSSQKCRSVSLNSALAKGPDGYMNNLLGLLLRWREEPIAIVGDIRKMFHSVHLQELEQHCHRFLWRDLNVEKEPDIYCMLRVNMGDKPAPAICTEAIYLTAEKFSKESPSAATMLRSSTYVDDIVDSFLDKATAFNVIKDAEMMLMKGGFRVKCWQVSGEKTVHSGGSLLKGDINEDSPKSLLKGDEEKTRVLGVSWIPDVDVIVFQVVLNFSQKKRGKRSKPNLTAQDIPESIPPVLTRRIVLEQVMAIFDPLGLLCPFTLLAKMYLRQTWERKLEWDDSLPDDLRHKWMKFFSTMFDLEQLKYDRHLHPPHADGKPWLVLFSDGSDIAYGVTAYVRWKLTDGSIWCRLIMAKNKIAPMTKLTTPQMELNGAVLSKRVRKVIEKEMRLEFERTLHIVDSETVLNMLNKTSTRYKVYEGVRIGEIQAATGGDMHEWAWISGKVNTADWLTRGRCPQQLGPDSEWWRGPSIIYEPLESWNLKFGLQKEDCLLPGEKKLVSVSTVCAQDVGTLSNCVDYKRFSNIRRLYWVIARILGILRAKSFSGGCSSSISPDLLREAECHVIKDVQRSISDEASKKNGKYSSLQPVLDQDGFWIIGGRLKRSNPMTVEDDPQKLLPYHHPVTHLIMVSAHEDSGHRSRDATLAKFRQKFWVPHGSKLAASVKHDCQLCKLREPVLLDQKTGLLPEDRLKPGPAFSKVMVDLFGPYKVRGEVQKRISGKAYGIIFTDLVMRAVHIEVSFGYDTDSFLLALSRFTGIRGWPDALYSDCGSQLVGAEKELRNVWLKLDQTAMVRKGTENGMCWKFGAPDSPWHQGAVESLVKQAKRSIHFAIHNQRLSPVEFLTICAEVSNLLNERPIGVMPASDSEINVLTPNNLLLGRASGKNPGNNGDGSTDLSVRYHFVHAVIDSFWKKWVELCAPALVLHKKWHTSCRNLQPGDVVVVSDSNSLRGEYRLGVVREVFPGDDGKVRKVSLAYKNPGGCNVRHGRVGDGFVTVMRSVKKLALLVQVDKSYHSNSGPPGVLESKE